MIDFLKKRMQILNEKLAQHEQLRVNTESEYLAMSCGSFNPKFLAKIKKSKVDNYENKTKEK